MTNTEIDHALALAIGYLPEHVRVFVDGYTWVWRNGAWYVFDHLDWKTIGPIAERYDAFPRYFKSGYANGAHWCAYKRMGHGLKYTAGTPQTAIALAVIEGVKK